MATKTEKEQKEKAPKMMTISLYVSEAVTEKLVERAAKDRRSVSQTAMILLEEALGIPNGNA
jgi:hypothetical protein